MATPPGPGTRCYMFVGRSIVSRSSADEARAPLLLGEASEGAIEAPPMAQNGAPTEKWNSPKLSPFFRSTFTP